MLLLELFKGTGSIGKVAKRKGYKIVSLDSDAKFKPDIHTDILDWDYKNSGLKPDVIWASPPCTEFSKFKTRGVRDYKLADSIVKKTLEIIDYFKPKYWFIENPIGKLKDRPYMKRLANYKHDITYCSYDKDFASKPTNVWTNKVDWDIRKETKENPCENTHINPATGKRVHNILVKNQSLCERYAIPTQLINTLLKPS